MQIVDVGNTVRLACSGYHTVTQVPITVRWLKENGRLPQHSHDDHDGTLIITNIQYSDSGVYICQAQNEGEIVNKRVSVTVGGKSFSIPSLFLS